MQSALGEIQEKSDITDAEVRANMDPTAPQEKGVQNWGWVQAIARAIDNRLTRTSSFTIERFLRDVFLYISRRDVQRRIDEIVEAKLTAEPTIVVGHSLGSVVAYNVVRRNRQSIDLRKFITVGSPLGLRAISSKLGVPENPAGADGWYNAYDERDIVALNPLDNVYFPANPSIVNNNRDRNKTDNRHGIIGYLNDRDVAEQIAAAWT
jgi:pimeloyl-ACP methyl ester carboxylesterase